MKIQKVTDESFKPYGRILKGYDLKDMLQEMENTPLPEKVIYEPSVEVLESLPIAEALCQSAYGGMPIQIGYCNGKNDRLNAVEYHRDSEVNIAVNDLILLLGKEQDISAEQTYETEKIEAFLIPAGTVIEVYATTLHYAPCGVDGNGFRCVVVLPAGTNTELKQKPEGKAEDRLLFARNKWLIAHPDAQIEGAFPGLRGENLTCPV